MICHLQINVVLNKTSELFLDMATLDPATARWPLPSERSSSQWQPLIICSQKLNSPIPVKHVNVQGFGFRLEDTGHKSTFELASFSNNHLLVKKVDVHRFFSKRCVKLTLE